MEYANGGDLANFIKKLGNDHNLKMKINGDIKYQLKIYGFM